MDLDDVARTARVFIAAILAYRGAKELGATRVHPLALQRIREAKRRTPGVAVSASGDATNQGYLDAQSPQVISVGQREHCRLMAS